MTHLSEQERQTLWRHRRRPHPRHRDQAQPRATPTPGHLARPRAHGTRGPAPEHCRRNWHCWARHRPRTGNRRPARAPTGRGSTWWPPSISGAYYLVPRVRELIGYPGQHPQPAAPMELAAEELSDEIFEAAMNYPGCYRPTPRYSSRHLSHLFRHKGLHHDHLHDRHPTSVRFCTSSPDASPATSSTAAGPRRARRRPSRCSIRPPVARSARSRLLRRRRRRRGRRRPRCPARLGGPTPSERSKFLLEIATLIEDAFSRRSRSWSASTRVSRSPPSGTTNSPV